MGERGGGGRALEGGGGDLVEPDAVFPTGRTCLPRFFRPPAQDVPGAKGSRGAFHRPRGR